jgi:cation:H+ antiporter
MIVELILLLSSLAIIAVVSDRIIVYVTKLSSYFGLSEMSAGFILLSVATSLPELFVSSLASLSNQGGLSVGNVLGSNIANLTVILGLAILISRTKITIDSNSEKDLVQFLFLSSLIPLFILQRGSIGPVLGVVLLILFVYFSINISKKAGKISSLGFYRKKEINFIIVKFLIAIGLILFLSKLVVDNGVGIAQSLGLPPSVIGATIIAFGTSLPELATTIQALKKRLFGMALGNIFGSCITNLTLVLGIASILSFSQVSVVATSSMLFFTLITALTIWYLISTKKYIGRKISLFIILIYVLFVLQQIGFSIFIL